MDHDVAPDRALLTQPASNTELVLQHAMPTDGEWVDWPMGPIEPRFELRFGVPDEARWVRFGVSYRQPADATATRAE